MVKTLQKKFVITSMIAITILIVALLGAINVANIVLVRRQSERTLNMISANEGNINNLPPINGENRPEMPPNRGKNDYDTFMASNFFIVRLSLDKSIIFTDVARTSTVSEEDAAKYAKTVVNSGEDEGKIDGYRYKVGKSAFNEEINVIFLDTSDERQSLIRVLLLSALIGFACFLIMLLIVILLSRKAIRPIAENIEKQKRFVTDAGHELKTPLAIIQSNAEAMELYNGENKWSKNIKEQTLRLSKMMENLLLLSRMDEGQKKAVKGLFDLSDSAINISDSFAESFKVRNIAFDTAIESGVKVNADKAQIEQLMGILLDNALKYTNEGGSAIIMCHKEEKSVVLSVENTCEALPNVDPKALFDRFYRGDTARNQATGGSGIGLSVARSIAVANDASITAEYISDNKIRFKLTLSEA